MAANLFAAAKLFCLSRAFIVIADACYQPEIILSSTISKRNKCTWDPKLGFLFKAITSQVARPWYNATFAPVRKCHRFNELVIRICRVQLHTLICRDIFINHFFENI